MEHALPSRDERIARRLRIGVRLVLYPTLLGLIALAWHHNHSQGAPASASWGGWTSQHLQVEAFTTDRRLTSFDTHLLERCTDGSSFDFHWYPSTPRFVQHGADVRAHTAAYGYAYDRTPLVFENRLDARIGGRAEGTIRGEVTLLAYHGVVRCDSGPVSFRLGVD